MSGEKVGSKKHFALLGESISYSVSPRIHALICEKLNVNADYILEDAPKGCLAQAVARLKQTCDGFNVTKPYKNDIVQFLDENTSEYGAVNTVRVKNGKLIGYNTDYYGFKKDFGAMGADTVGKIALVLGAGGAARIAVAALKDMGANVFIYNRTHSKAAELAAVYGAEAICDGGEIVPQIIVNCTTAGLHGEQAMCPWINLKGLQAVYDMVYLPETPFVKIAQQHGAKTLGGKGMLIWQAIAAQGIWNEINIDPLKANEIYEYVNGKINFT